MAGRYTLLSGWILGILGVLSFEPRAVQAEKKPVVIELSDRISPIVRVVQKCQGAVVAVINPETNKPKGTGIIVTEGGLIITNAHVVAGEKKLKIQLLDKTELVGDVLTVAGSYDLAVVKVTTSHKLDILPPASSDQVFLGEDVVAIGHPYGYSYSISRGILSGLGRKITTPAGDIIDEVYQTDAPINPGNSGGPLMNVRGELIAINFAVRDQAQSIAFCIPVKKVREILLKHTK